MRPVRWLVAMLDSEIIPLELGGIRGREDFTRAQNAAAAAMS